MKQFQIVTQANENNSIRVIVFDGTKQISCEVTRFGEQHLYYCDIRIRLSDFLVTATTKTLAEIVYAISLAKDIKDDIKF